MASLKKRGGTYYLQYYLPGRKQKRVNLETDSYQIAREKLRQFDSARATGETSPLPTRTSLPELLTAYVEYVRTVKTGKSAQTDIYYLRDVFGPVCDALTITSRKPSPGAKKRPPKPGQDRRRKATVIESPYLEQVTTADVAVFIDGRVRERGLAPKTANRYREILTRLFNWATAQRGVRLPGGANPAASVERRREPAPVIRFLTIKQIDQQIDALAGNPRLQAMAATYIYAGLRREELLWLTHDDIDWDAKPYGLIRVRAKKVDGAAWEPKTKTNRAVPISSRLRPYLDRQRLRAGKSPWLFPSPEGKRWDPDNFSAALRDANSCKSLADWWSCLTYRHTFGSQLAMKGESLYKIATLMGNSPEICRRHYAALLPESLTTTVEFGDNAIPPTPARVTR